MNQIQIASAGKAFLPIAAPEVLYSAAEELSHYLKRITGASFDICEQGEPAIYLSVDEALAAEEIAVITDENGITLSGGSVRGAFYAVYAFLEDVLGVRFYTHDATKVPSVPELSLEYNCLRDKPALEYRQLDGPLQSFGDWMAHNRLNASRAHEEKDCLDRYGGGKKYALFVHTFDKLVPPELYFDEHPEYFALRDGARVGYHSQLCLTNPEVLAIATESVRRELRANPDAAIISVSQNDGLGTNCCTCPECARVDAEEGSHSGTLIRFVNAIAESIEEEFPHVLVDTLAYRYTRRPPKLTHPRPNVCVRLCSIECCFGHPLEECNEITGPFAHFREPGDATFQEDLIGWGKICKNVYIWDYVTNFIQYWLPFPNLHILGPNMRFFVKNGVQGVYAEGNYSAPSPDLNELRQWLIAKLMWNPDFNVEKGISEFAEFVYGAAAEEIVDYIHLLRDRVLEGNIHFGIYEPASVGYLDENTLKKAQSILADALKKPLSLSQRIYVEKMALTLEFTEVAQQTMRNERDAARIDAMLEKGRTLGVTALCEFVSWQDMGDQLRGLGKHQRNIFAPR